MIEIQSQQQLTINGQVIKLKITSSFDIIETQDNNL